MELRGLLDLVPIDWIWIPFVPRFDCHAAGEDLEISAAHG